MDMLVDSSGPQKIGVVMDDKLVICCEVDIELEHVLKMTSFFEELKGVLRTLEASSPVTDAKYFFTVCEGVKGLVAVAVFLPKREA
jgi:hypothetical protein